jgi:hypothetical protein
MSERERHPLDGFDPLLADPRVTLNLDFLTDPEEVRSSAGAARAVARTFADRFIATGDKRSRDDHDLFMELANGLASYAARLDAGTEALAARFAEDVEAWRASGNQ